MINVNKNNQFGNKNNKNNVNREREREFVCQFGQQQRFEQQVCVKVWKCESVCFVISICAYWGSGVQFFSFFAVGFFFVCSMR